MSFKEFYESADLPLAPAVFIGIQHFPKAQMELFNLTKDIGKFKTGTTLSRKTIESLGYFIPAIPDNTPRDTPLDKLIAEAFTKKNPFNLKKPKEIKPKQSKLPKKAFKQELKQKMKREDMLIPRNWQVGKSGKLNKISK